MEPFAVFGGVFLLFVVIVLVSVALFLQGHNRPGGGFIAGVLTA
ncbi:MAG: MnhB domain-containing protein, partial [Haloferacaceae archaeon]